METGERPPIPLHDLLGIMVAPEFECSVAAAELNAAVAELFQRKPAYPAKELVDITTQRQAYYQIAPTSWEAQSMKGLNYRLVMARERDTTVGRKVPLEQQPGFRSLLRKLIGNPEAPEVAPRTVQPDHPPMLAALVQDSLLIPIATFERRQDGACSFVQIGSEIRDDKLHAVRTDDAVASRKEIIEEIGSFASKTRTIPEGILSLLATEFDSFSDNLLEHFEQKAATAANRVLRLPKYGSSLIAVTPDGEPAIELPYTLRPLSVPFVGKDERTYTFVVAKEGQDGRHTIGIITRGQVYLPLVNFHPGLPHFETVGTKQRLRLGQLQMLTRFININTSPVHQTDELAKHTKAGNQLLEELAPNLQEMLPPAAERSHEQLIDFMGQADCSRALVGEIPSVNIGTVKGDLNIRAEFQRNTEQFTCTIYGAPKALGTEPVRLYELSVNAITGEVSDPDRAAEVLNLLTTLQLEAKK